MLSILILVWSGGLGARVATAAAAPTGQIQRRGRSGSSVLASANSRVKRASVARGRAIMLWVGEHEWHNGVAAAPSRLISSSSMWPEVAVFCRSQVE